MRRFPLAFIAVALAAPAFLAPPVQATDDLPIVASGSGTGNMWYAVKIPAGARHVVIEDHVQNASGGFFLAWGNFYYDAQGELIGSEGLSGAPTDEFLVHAEGDGLPYVHQEVLPRPPGYSKGGTTIGCATCAPIAEAFTLVTVVTNASGPWSFTVRTSDPIQLSVDWGNTAWLYRARDFDGDVNAQVSPGVLTRANLDTSILVHSEDTLIGFYERHKGEAPLESWIETPHGTEPCPCAFLDHAAGPNAWGPGDYRFHLTDVDVDDEVLLFAASIRLPA